LKNYLLLAKIKKKHSLAQIFATRAVTRF